MKCETCTATDAPIKGSHVTGSCDACGWALIVVDGKETPRLHPVVPEARALVALVEAEARALVALVEALSQAKSRR